MKRKLPAVAVEDCGHCPAFMPDPAATMRVNGFSVIPSRLAAQVADGVWNAVVTSFGRGTILVRRRAGLPASACPLRAYEVRHVPAELPPVRKRSGGGAEQMDRVVPKPARAGTDGVIECNRWLNEQGGAE